MSPGAGRAARHAPTFTRVNRANQSVYMGREVCGFACEEREGESTGSITRAMPLTDARCSRGCSNSLYQRDAELTPFRGRCPNGPDNNRPPCSDAVREGQRSLCEESAKKIACIEEKPRARRESAVDSACEGWHVGRRCYYTSRAGERFRAIDFTALLYPTCGAASWVSPCGRSARCRMRFWKTHQIQANDFLSFWSVHCLYEAGSLDNTLRSRNDHRADQVLLNGLQWSALREGNHRNPVVQAPRSVSTAVLHPCAFR